MPGRRGDAGPALRHCELRDASPSLREGLLSLWKHCFPLVDVESLQSWDDDGTVVIHCWRRGRVVGSVMLERQDDKQGRKTALRRLSVANSDRCHGLGGRLVRMAIELHHARSPGALLLLHVNTARVEHAAHALAAACDPSAAMPSHWDLSAKERFLVGFYRALGFDDLPGREHAERAGLDWDEGSRLMVYMG